jgi:hypothetical protein
MIINKQEAEAQLVGLQTAVTTGKIAVRVTDTSDPAQPIEGALVTVTDGTTITGTTDANGEVTLEVSFSGMNVFTTKPVKVTATKPDGFTQNDQSEKTVTVIAVATIDVNLVLIPQ